MFWRQDIWLELFQYQQWTLLVPEKAIIVILAFFLMRLLNKHFVTFGALIVSFSLFFLIELVRGCFFGGASWKNLVAALLGALIYTYSINGS